MSRVPLSARAASLVERLFAAELRELVIDELETQCGSALPLWQPVSPEGLERIRFAVLKLSRGSIEEFSRALEIARIDWRDVLVAAGFGDDVTAHLHWADEQLAKGDLNRR